MNTALLVLLSAFMAGFPVAEATAVHSVDSSVKLDHSKVRYGNPGDFDPEKGQKVATVRSKDVYKAIPAYQTIVKEKVKQGTARYTKLMQEATKQWRKGLAAVAGSGSYVLVVEQGGITGYPTSDITADIIQAL